MHLQVKYNTTISSVIHPNSNNHASLRTPFLQCSSAFFLSSSIELLFPPCCTSPYTGCAALPSSTLLSLFSPSCTFFLMGRAGLLSLWCAFSSFGHATLFTFLSHRGHHLHLCPSSPHLKHFTATILIFLIVLSSTLYCITLLFKISNLFWGIVAPFPSSFLFLQFWARCPNPLHRQHNFPLLLSISTLNLARACFSLSKLLIRDWYCS